MRATQHTKEIGDFDYYLSYTLTNLYVEQTFGGLLSTLNIVNGSTTDTAQFSWDGATLAGEVQPGESVKLNVDQKTSVYVKGTAGGDAVRLWGYADVSASSIAVSFSPLGVVNKSYEDTNFVTGDSPVTIDFNADAGRNSKEGWVTCDGPGNILVAFSRDGITFGDDWTVKAGESTNLTNFDVDTLRITWVTDSAYRVVLI
jgi:hypothetical protein